MSHGGTVVEKCVSKLRSVRLFISLGNDDTCAHKRWPPVSAGHDRTRPDTDRTRSGHTKSLFLS